MRSPVQIRLAAPHSRKASLATPRKFLRGVRVCACACVYASQKYGRSPRSSFCHFVPKLSRCSLIFAPRGWRLPPPVFTPAENQRFSPGDPEAPCVNSARRSDGAKYAIPSLRSLQTRSHRDPPKRETAGCTHNLRLTPARLLFEAAFSSYNRNDRGKYLMRFFRSHIHGKEAGLTTGRGCEMMEVFEEGVGEGR